MDDSAPASPDADPALDEGTPSGGDGELTHASKRTRLARWGAIFVVALVVGSLANFTFVRRAMRGRVLPRVTVLGTNIGGTTPSELTKRLTLLSSKVDALEGSVRIRDRVFAVTGREVGAVIDLEGTTRRALAVGRDASLVRQLSWYLARPFSNAVLRPSLRFDVAKLEAKLSSVERATLGDAAVEGNVAFNDRIVTTMPRGGFGVVRDRVTRLLERAVLDGPAAAIELPVAAVVPKVTHEEVEAAMTRAARLIEPITLRAEAGDGVLGFDAQDLGHALRSRIVDRAPHLELFVDRDALRPVLARRRSELEKPARDATFVIGANHEVSVVPSELGTRLDDESILDTVLGLTDSKERAGTLAVRRDVVPTLTTEGAEALHVRALVSRYTTPFPCCEARVKNIERVAALVNGSIVQPGEQYSLNEHTGQRTAANGFVAGPTIVEGEMEMTVGGGVSQFATTMFNAAFDGGYEIIQRQPHTYWFPRYPEGYDATLGFPLPDLVFRNDTAAAIFVKAEVGKNFVRVEFYGDNGGRKVERHVSPRFDIVKPDTVSEPNPDLAPDETKVLFGGWIGWSLQVTRVITFPDGRKQEEKRKVTYSPRARRVAVHPCRLPEGAPGYTGEKCPKLESPDGGVK